MWHMSSPLAPTPLATSTSAFKLTFWQLVHTYISSNAQMTWLLYILNCSSQQLWLWFSTHILWVGHQNLSLVSIYLTPYNKCCSKFFHQSLPTNYDNGSGSHIRLRHQIASLLSSVPRWVKCHDNLTTFNRLFWVIKFTTDLTLTTDLDLNSMNNKPLELVSQVHLSIYTPCFWALKFTTGLTFYICESAIGTWAKIPKPFTINLIYK